MSDTSLNQLLSLINQHIEEQEALSEQLLKAHALALAMVSGDFLECSKHIVHGCLWALESLIEQAKQLCGQSLDVLLKGMPAASVS